MAKVTQDVCTAVKVALEIHTQKETAEFFELSQPTVSLIHRSDYDFEVYQKKQAEMFGKVEEIEGPRTRLSKWLGGLI